MPSVAVVSSGAEATGALHVLYRFGGNRNGMGPREIVFGAAGTIVGLTQEGGGPQCPGGDSGYAGCGTLFALTPSGSTYTETVLHRFRENDGGASPFGLVMGPGGAIYGATAFTWGNGCGTVFRLMPRGSSYNFKTLHAFSGFGACAPGTSPVIGNDGTIYGGTRVGGAYGYGVFYALHPTSGGYSEEVLYNFAGGKDGSNAIGRIVQTPSGSFFGTTLNGGSRDCNGVGCGTVYALLKTSSGYAERVIHRFTAKDGLPWDGLTLGPGGNLYGTSSLYACGFVFEVNPSTYAYSVVHQFSDAEGCAPDGLAFDRGGNAYGTTESNQTAKTEPACPGGCGTVFELRRSGSGYAVKTLAVLRHRQGRQPVSGVIIHDGMLYGTASGGGIRCKSPNALGGCGTVFALKP